MPKRLRALFTDRSLLTKLIISLFIIVIPLYVFNYMINNIGAHKNREEISNALTNSVTSYNNIIEGEIIRLQQMLQMSALDIAIDHVPIIRPDLSYTEKTIFMASVRDYLNRIQYSSRFITDTTAYLPLLDAQLSVTSPGIQFNRAEFSALSAQPSTFTAWNGQLFLNVPFVTNTSHQEGMFILAARISKEAIAAYLSKIMNYNRSGAIFYDLRDNWELSTPGMSDVSAEIRRYLAERAPAQRQISPATIHTVEIGEESYLIVYESSVRLGTMLVAYAPESEIYGSLGIYRLFFYTMSILSVVIIVLFSLWLYKLIHKPMRSLIQAFRKVEIGNLDFALVHHHKDEFGYLYHRFNDMLHHLNTMVHVVYEQKILNQRSELKRLQAQINPHFLYNNFFVLQRLIRSGHHDKSAAFAEYLGKYFQFVTRNAADEIPLQEDAGHAKTYLDIQSVCFHHRITIEFEPVPPEIAQVPVPRLILQPILENSFNHAFEKHLSDGHLSVTFRSDESFIRIIVEDNGKLLDDAQLAALSQRLELSDRQQEESTGIMNVHRRIRLKFGERSGLGISRSALGGLKTEIAIDRGKVNE